MEISQETIFASLKPTGSAFPPLAKTWSKRKYQGILYLSFSDILVSPGEFIQAEHLFEVTV